MNQLIFALENSKATAISNIQKNGNILDSSSQWAESEYTYKSFLEYKKIQKHNLIRNYCLLWKFLLFRIRRFSSFPQVIPRINSNSFYICHLLILYYRYYICNLEL